MVVSPGASPQGWQNVLAPRIWSFLWGWTVCCLFLNAVAAENYLPAFPGAEGYGAFTPGGRGGKVLFVTTLEDYNAPKGEAPIPGSLRAALTARGPRIVMFRISGTVFLKAPLKIDQPDLTVAGQSAPGDGICL